MARTKSALKILKRRRGKDPELKKEYEEESLKYQIALGIRKLREEFGLTQAQLAEKIGTTQSAIARLESTDYEGYSIQTLQRIATVFNRHLKISFEPAA